MAGRPSAGYASCVPHFAYSSRWALCASLGATLLVEACTFYTGQPNGNPAPPTNTAGANGGTAGSNAASAPGKGGDGSIGGTSQDAGSGGDATETIPWVDATGSLTGKSISPGDVQFLSAKPSEDMLIAGLAGFGLWASNDGGRKWRGLGTSGDSDAIINGVVTLVYDPDHPKVFWESGIYFGPALFRTDDNGVTTKQLGDVIHTDSVSVDFTDPDRQTLLAGPHEKTQILFLSRDGGQTWQQIGDNLPEKSGFSSWPLVLDSQTFLVGLTNQIVRSADGGATWDVVSTSGGAGHPLQASDGSIYWSAQADGGVMRSTDQGLTWNRVVGANILHGQTLLELPDGRLVGQNYDYVLVSPDGGDSWQVASAPFPFRPAGLVYSRHQKAFYIFTDSQETKIPARSIVRFDWDYETQ